MMPDDPLFDRVMWAVVRFVFLPALLVLGLAIMVFFIVGMVQTA